MVLVLTGDLVAREIGRPNIWFYNLFFSAQQLFIIGFTGYLAPKKWNKAFLGLGVLYASASTFNMLFVQKMDVLNTYTAVVAGVFILGGSYFVLRHKMLQGQFIVNGVTMFLMANIFYYGVANSVLSSMSYFALHSEETGNVLMNFNKFAYCLWSLIIAIGFLWKKPLTT